MPELPEVETIRRQLAPELEGRRIERAEVLDARWSEPAVPVATRSPFSPDARAAPARCSGSAPLPAGTGREPSNMPMRS